MTATVVKFPLPNQQDIPATLRHLAGMIEDGTLPHSTLYIIGRVIGEPPDIFWCGEMAGNIGQAHHEVVLAGQYLGLQILEGPEDDDDE